MDYESSSATVDGRRALRLRALAVSNLLKDLWGTEVLNAIVAELLQKFRGRNFTYDDFTTLVQAHGVSWERQLGDMIFSTRLPGFVVSNFEQKRIQSDEERDPTFETKFTLLNGESTAGYCLVTMVDSRYSLDSYFIFANTPVFVDKNQLLEVLIHSKSPIYHIVVEPYLSLNRTKLELSAPILQNLSDEERGSQGRPEIVSTREIEVDQFGGASYIVVDDLDPGFSVVDTSSRFKFEPITALVSTFRRNINE